VSPIRWLQISTILLCNNFDHSGHHLFARLLSYIIVDQAGSVAEISY